MKRRTFGKRFLGGLAALMAVPFVKSKTDEELLAEITPSNAELKKLAEQNPPPRWWYEVQEECPFGWSSTIKYENGRTECYRNGKLVSVTELSDRGVGTF